MSSDTDRINDIICKILLVSEEEAVHGFTKDENEEWDSMTHLVLISEIENTFNIAFSDDEVVEMTSISDIRSTLKKHSINLQ